VNFTEANVRKPSSPGLSRVAVPAHRFAGRLAALGPAADLSTAIGTLLVRAQRAGAIRPDLGVDDLMLILKAGFGATREADDRQRRLTFSVILDGLRRVEP
ncbi:hypothetical protein ACFWFQ_11945, partial [Nocardia salmonicida]|uniref:SbtR family transcriptional regulator n=1 Tax=Nocardia salmonicida TaxID=53431 RepID=UPI003646908D